MVAMALVDNPWFGEPTLVAVPGNTNDLPPNEPCLITADTGTLTLDTGMLTPGMRTPGMLTRATGTPEIGTPTVDMGTLTLVNETP